MKSCDVCGEPMLADELGLRHAGCRAEYERQRGRRRRTEARELDWHHPARVVTRQQTNVRVTRKREADAWLRTDDARWSSDPEPERLDRNPAAVYLAGKPSATGRRGLKRSLDRAAELLTSGRTKDAMAVDWTEVRYQHVTALRSVLIEEGAKPATVNHVLAAVRGTLKEAWRLGQIDAETLARACDVSNVTDLAQLSGGTRIVPSLGPRAGDPQGRSADGDWQSRRIGISPPAEVVDLRSSAGLSILAACGIPIPLVAEKSDSASLREAMRQLVYMSIMPVARIIERELQRVLELELRLDFAALNAADIMGRARSFKSLVDGGLPIPEARSLTGMD